MLALKALYRMVLDVRLQERGPRCRRVTHFVEDPQAVLGSLVSLQGRLVIGVANPVLLHSHRFIGIRVVGQVFVGGGIGQPFQDQQRGPIHGPGKGLATVNGGAGGPEGQIRLDAMAGPELGCGRGKALQIPDHDLQDTGPVPALEAEEIVQIVLGQGEEFAVFHGGGQDYIILNVIRVGGGPVTVLIAVEVVGVVGIVVPQGLQPRRMGRIGGSRRWSSGGDQVRGRRHQAFHLPQGTSANSVSHAITASVSG